MERFFEHLKDAIGEEEFQSLEKQKLLKFFEFYSKFCRYGSGPMTKNEILSCIENKEIIIDPYDPTTISNASVDLSFSNELRIFRTLEEIAERFSINKRNSDPLKNIIFAPVIGKKIPNYLDFYKPAKIRDGQGFLLRINERLIGRTEQKITLNNRICAFIFARSSVARFNLKVEFAPFIEPEVDNHTVLELKNDAWWHFVLVPGAQICKIIFFRATNLDNVKEKYQGQYQAQQLILPNEVPMPVGMPLKYIEGTNEQLVEIDPLFIYNLNTRYPVP